MLKLVQYLLTIQVGVYAVLNQTSTQAFDQVQNLAFQSSSFTARPTRTQSIQFLQYTAQYNKKYSTRKEFAYRFNIWIEADNFIKQQSSSTYQLSHNQFSDQTQAEKDTILNPYLSTPPDLDYENLTSWIVAPIKNFQKVVKCPDGQRLSGTKCLNCTQGCKTCTSDIACTSCMSSKFLLSKQTCTCTTGPYNNKTNDCDTCGSKQYYDTQTKTCLATNVANCELGASATKCQNCTLNYTLTSSGSCQCTGTLSQGNCIVCKSNQFLSNLNCVNCPQNCSTCSSPMGACLTCTSTTMQNVNSRCACAENQFVSATTGSCTLYTYCKPGTYNDGQNNCKPCGLYCTTCNAGSGYCNQCNDSSFEIYSQNISTSLWNIEPTFQKTLLGQCRCPPRYQLQGSKCYPLTVTCPNGFYNNGTNVCSECQLGCATCTDFLGYCMTCNDNSFNQTTLQLKGECQCPTGKTKTLSGVCQPTVTCAAGQYSDGFNNCLTCSANCTTCNDITGYCKVCKPTYSLISSTDMNCRCTSNQYLNAGNNSCVTLINCGLGKYNDGVNNCFACNSPNCDTCTNTGVCTKCTSTYTYSAANDTCYCPYPTTFWQGSTNKCITITACADPKFNPGNNVCQNCPTNCQDCQSSLYDFTGVCLTCKTGGYVMDTLSNCNCVGATYSSGTQCLACPQYCATCSDLTGACTSCTSPTFTVTQGQCQCINGVINSLKVCAPLVTCTDGFYNDGINNCLACPANSLTCTSATSVTTCKATYTLGAVTAGVCGCLAGSQFESGGQCINLINCGTYYYNNGANSCYGCKGNCTYCTSATVCTGCISPYTLNYPVAGNCACNIYTYQYYGQNNCQPCWAGYGCGVCRDWDGYCTTCKADWTWSGWYCYCWAPSYYNGLDCYPCARGCWSCAGSICYSCKATYTLHYPTSNVCGCLANQFVNSNGDCQNCGSYAYACAATTGAATYCYAGFQIVNGACVCASNQIIQTSAITGLPTCVSLIACPAGQYNNGANVCVGCPANANCLTCALTAGVPKCTSCAATYTLDVTRGTYGSCFCQTTQYVTSTNQCANCAANTLTCAASTGFSLTCQPTYSVVNNYCDCLPTQFKSTSNTCVNCPTYCATCTSSSICNTCVATFTLSTSKTCTCTSSQYFAAVNSTCVTIFPPPLGFYNNGQNVMIACGANCNVCTSAAAGACTTCAATFTRTAGNCACNPTTQILSGTTCVNLITCAAGTYNDGTNNCIACLKNCTTCSRAANNCTSCPTSYTLNFPTPGSCACGRGQYLSSTGRCVFNTANCQINTDVTGVCTQCNSTFTYTSTTNTCGCTSTQAIDKTTTPQTCKNCPNSCVNCTTPTQCIACKTGYIQDIKAKTCSCNSTSFDNGGLGCVQLIKCPVGQFNNGSNTCRNCDANCVSCNDKVGDCNLCATGFTLRAGVCNKLLTNNGKPRLMSSNSTQCGIGCQHCDTNGICNQCNEGMILSSLNDNECLYTQNSTQETKNCLYPIGPVEDVSPARCLNEMYNSARLVPEFQLSDQNVDWRTWGVIRPVQNQGKCGAGHVFSTTAATEAAFAIKTGKLHDLSEQYLLDCDLQSQGCSGGYLNTASFVLATSGVVLEQDYKFVGTAQQCKQVTTTPVFQLKYPGSQYISSNKDAFKSALRQGPLNIAIKVESDSFYFYSGGILPASICTNSKHNHAMLAIGFGEIQGTEYAILQNIWGTRWGESGILRIELTDDLEGPCGLYLQASFQLV